MVATEEKLKQVVIRSDGNMSKAARKLGVTPQAVAKRLSENPKLKASIQEICKKGLAKAGADLDKIFLRTAEGLDAVKEKPAMKIKLGEGEDAGISNAVVYEVDFKERRESAKLCHLLVGNLQDKDKDGITNRPVVIMPVIQINGVDLDFGF